MVVSNTFLQGDALSMLKSLPDECVQMVCTSPPYFGLRAYLPDGHPDKSLEIGLEETPAAYVATLVEVFREVRRVLRSDGTVWLNLGDSFSSGGRASQCEPGVNVGHRGMRNGKAIRPPAIEGIKPKDLMMIPARVAIALCDDGWYLRSDIIWNKTNAMPESVKDRPTKAHEYVFLLSKNERYFYDADSIREDKEDRHYPTWEDRKLAGEPLRRGDPGQSGHVTHFAGLGAHPAGRNKRSVWSIAEPRFKLRDNLTPEQKAHVVGELLRRGLL